MSFVAAPRPRHPPILLQAFIALIGGVFLFLLGIGLITGGYQLLFSGMIFPGVHIAGMDLSGLTPSQASDLLQQQLIYPEKGQVVFRYGDNVWVATPKAVGMTLDVNASVQSAYQIGRQGGWFDRLVGQIGAWQNGQEVAPIIILDERTAYRYLQSIAAQIDRPVIETELSLHGTEVLYRPGQTGRLLNVDATLEQLIAQLKTFRDGEVPLIIEEKAPLIADASAEAESLRQALSAALTLTIPDAQSGDPGPWVIEPPMLAGLFTVQPVEVDGGWRYQILVDTYSLEQFLGQLAPLVNRSAVNARFIFNDYTRQLELLQHASIGRTLDIAASRDAIVQGLLKGEHTIPLVLTLNPPDVTDDMTAEMLGITELVSKGPYNVSYFRGSSPDRLQNIETAARRFHGLLVPPHATFSMAEALGDISLENGYAEAPIIYNGRTIVGVGGGVCQVSTTLFRTAFFAGYPIVERHAHAFRVSYYEQTATRLDIALAGLDATVYVPLVDLKFTNDRPYWLLMETYFNRSNYSLEWKFYSTDDGRTVQWENMGLRNVVPAPEPLFEENPDFPPGYCKQVDYAADGADITVTRVIYRNGQQLYPPETFHTHYLPWQAIYQYGPGTENPAALAAAGLCR